MAPKKPWTQRTGVDEKLMRRTGLDEVTLTRLRRQFHWRHGAMTYKAKKSLSDGATATRFAIMQQLIEETITANQQAGWRSYINHSPRDLDEMCNGLYPISPYMLRIYSALYGIRVDYLYLGNAPVVDTKGASIDVWPMAADAK